MLGLRGLVNQSRKDMHMPGNRSAPDVTGSPTKVEWSFQMIDAHNTRASNSILTDPAATNAQVEAAAAALQAGSNASLWRITQTNIWTGVALSSSALDAPIVSVKDAIRLQTTDLTTQAYNPAYMFAPLTVLITDQDTVDTSNAIYTAWRDAVQVLLPTGFALLNTGFVQNVQRNQSVSPI